MTRKRKTTDRDALGAGNVDLSGESTGRFLTPVTPGEVLREEFMVPMSVSACALARDIGVPANRITGILHGERAITADTALRLSRRFKVSAEFWMNSRRHMTSRRLVENFTTLQNDCFGGNSLNFRSG